MAVSKAQYWAIKNSLTGAEKQLINYYEAYFFLRKRVPTLEEVVNHLKKTYPKTNHLSVNYYLQRKLVRKALDDRGIPFEEGMRGELTPTQTAAAITVMNFADERSIEDKLAQLGINATQYYAWLNQPEFKSFVDSLADNNLKNIRPTAIAEFTKKINSGDWNAIKYWMHTTGELAQDKEISAKVLVPLLIEIIQKHVKDPAILSAIAEDVKNVTATQETLTTVKTQYSLPGEVVEDDMPAMDFNNPVDFEKAKKMIGF